MFLQFVLKGIALDDDSDAQQVLRDTGILCNWWRKVRTITPMEIKEQLNERNLDWHLNRYQDRDPLENNEQFFVHTPFISTTAGAVERDQLLHYNWIHPPLVTALQFATKDYTVPGYIYYGYVFTLGKKSIELASFAEEVRELHVYTQFMPYQLEGEIVAKILIPSVNLEKYEKYDPQQALDDLRAGRRPDYIDVQYNDSYANPERFSNLRGFVE